MNTALITGGGGFAGHYLTGSLLRRGWKVISADCSPQKKENYYSFLNRVSPGDFSDYDFFSENFQAVLCDITKDTDVTELYRNFKFERIFHLAGLPFIPDNTRSPLLAARLNTVSPLLLLDTAREFQWEGTFLYVSSGDLYSREAGNSGPLTEESVLDISTPYCITKRAAEQLISFYNSERVRVLIARPFNHTGPGQKETFVAPAFVYRIRRAIREGKDYITTGDLRSFKDFSDVRDVAEAYITIAERGKPGEIYNVCSGRAVSIEELLSLIMSVAGVKLKTVTDPALLRDEPPRKTVGSSARLQELGWRPLIPLRKTIEDLWNFSE